MKSWMEWIWMVVGALLGAAMGFPAACYGAPQMPWWLLALALGMAAVLGWLIGKRLVRRTPADFGADVADGPMKMVLVFLESGFRALPIVAWLLGLWIGSAAGALLAADWRVALGVAAWPLATAAVFAAKVSLQERLRRTVERGGRTKLD
jgi:hypothetical protein